MSKQIKIPAAILAEHKRRHKGMLLEEIAEILLQDIRAMDSDQKAHLRARLDRSFGFAPKTSGGKPS
jgi:hypothetical protein